MKNSISFGLTIIVLLSFSTAWTFVLSPLNLISISFNRLRIPSFQDVSPEKNIHNQHLEVCSLNPLTGWFRDGYARTDHPDRGNHVVCATMTQEFLDYTKSMDNDLSIPRLWFSRLRPGDHWALSARRWYQAQRAGCAPMVKLDATNKKALTIIPLGLLERYDDTIIPYRETRLFWALRSKCQNVIRLG